MLDRLLFRHPADLGESYGEHRRAAHGFAWPLLGAGLACLVHGIIPGWFETTGSRTVASLHQRLSSRRTAAPPDGRPTRHA